MTQNETKKLLTRFAAWNLMLLLSLILHIESPFASNITYAYDGAGRLSKAQYDNGMTIEYTYDNNGNLLSRVVSSGGSAAYTLTVVKTGTGSGTVTGPGISCGSDCSEDVDQGKTAALKAKADVNSTFTGWLGGGCSGTGTCQVTMNSSIAVTANFDLKIPDISVAQTTVDFGSAAIGKRVKKTLAITNNGAGALSITLEGLAGTDFSTTVSAVTVKAKKTYNLKLTFKATSPGQKTATLKINSNDPDTPTVNVALTGTGQ